MSCSEVAQPIGFTPASVVEGPSRESPELPSSPPSEKKICEVAVLALQSGSEGSFDLSAKKIEPVAISEAKNSHDGQPTASQEQKTAEETHDSLASAKARQKKLFKELSEKTPQQIEETIARMSPEDVSAFVEHRKILMGKRLDAWKKDYNPAPTLALKMAGLSTIVRLESMDVLEMLIDEVTKAKSREKIASVLRKNEAIMKKNTSHMDSATQKKMTEGLEIIKRELSRLGNPPEPVKKSKEKKVQTVDRADPLFSEKTEFLHKVEEALGKDFRPQAAFLLSCFSGEEVAERAKGLFVDLRKRVIKAESKQACLKVFKRMQELIAAYQAAVNGATSKKLDAVLGLIETTQKTLEAGK